MPSMANITVKASNGSTDVVYVAKSPSAGDRVPARWAVDAASTIPANRPKASLVSRDNGNRNARTFNFEYSYPITAVENTIVVLKAVVPIKASLVLPTNCDATVVKEAIHQFGNLLVSTLMRSAFEDGYAPT